MSNLTIKPYAKSKCLLTNQEQKLPEIPYVHAHTHTDIFDSYAWETFERARVGWAQSIMQNGILPCPCSEQWQEEDHTRVTKDAKTNTMHPEEVGKEVWRKTRRNTHSPPTKNDFVSSILLVNHTHATSKNNSYKLLAIAKTLEKKNFPPQYFNTSNQCTRTHMQGKVCERERKRERQSDRDRDRDREKDRVTERETERQSDRDRETE